MNKRYVVVEGGYSDESNTKTWLIKDTVTGHGVIPDMKRYFYTTEDEAQQRADILNQSCLVEDIRYAVAKNGNDYWTMEWDRKTQTWFPVHGVFTSSYYATEFDALNRKPVTP